MLSDLLTTVIEGRFPTRKVLGVRAGENTIPPKYSAIKAYLIAKGKNMIDKNLKEVLRTITAELSSIEVVLRITTRVLFKNDLITNEQAQELTPSALKDAQDRLAVLQGLIESL